MRNSKLKRSTALRSPATGRGLGRFLVALLLFIGAGWLGDLWVEARRARAEAESAARFTDQLPSQEAKIAAIFERPIHDPSAALSSIRQQLATVVQRLDLEHRRRAYPAVREALGRLFLAAGDAPAAALFFDSLWRHGQGSEGLAELRARAHGGLTVGALVAPGIDGEAIWGEAPEQDSSRKSRQAWAESLNKTADVDPGVGRWLQSWQDEDRTAGFDALRDLLSALDSNESASAPFSVGRLHLVAARWADSLDRREDSRSHGERAEQLLSREVDSRPSDWRGHLALCAARLHLLQLDMGSEPTLGLFARAEASCQDGLIARPDSVPLLVGLAQADLLHAQHRLHQGLAAQPFIRAGRATAQRALELEPEHAGAELQVKEAERLAARGRSSANR